MAHALQSVATWATALQGDGDLGAAVEPVMGLLPATAMRLDRCMADESPVRRIYASAQAGLRGVNRPAVVGQARSGSVIMDDTGRTAVIVLGTQASHQDTCEIALSQPLTYAQAGLLNLVAAELAYAWARRQPGMIARRIVAQTRRHGHARAPSPTAPILDYSNPYGLSRCEFRVCRLIGMGMTAKRIADALHLSEATVRSHQRAIYAKTELSGQIAVMLHLKAYPTAQSLLQDASSLAA